MGLILTYVALSTLLILGGLWAHLKFWSWYYRRGALSGEISYTPSTDGWRLALERIRPASHTVERGVIICCPGLACNGRIFHLTPQLSWANTLSQAGYDVWIIHPRGVGPSERAQVKKEWAYGYNNYVKDGVVIAEHIFEQTKRRALWVGHSMGGLIGYEVVSRAHKALYGLVTIGTPTNLSAHPISKLHYAMFKWFCWGLPVSYLGKLSTLVSPWAAWILWLHPAPLYTNMDTLPREDLRRLLVQALEDTPRQLIQEFIDAINGRGSLSEQGWGRYRAMLRALPVPLLAIAGDRDGLAPLEVTEMIKEWGPRGKTTFKVVGGYGHGDLIISGAACDELIPLIDEWAQRVTDTH